MKKTLYTASALWQGPYDNEKVLFLSGITQNIYANLRLEDSFDPDYTQYCAFKLVGTNENDLGRIYKPRSSDNLVVTNIDDGISFGIDNDKNLIIFPEGYFQSQAEYQLVRVKLIQNFASIFKSNLVSFDYVNDLQIHNEKAITSMLASDDGIYLCGISGKVWFFDGYVIKGPVFACYDGADLPISSIVKHRFAHETEDYLYIATDTKPRLYRSKLSTAKNGYDWEEVYASGELASSSGGILCMTSAFNKIFLGCRNNKILSYSRTNSIVLSSPVDYITESVVETDTPVESLSTSQLFSNNIDDFETQSVDITSLEVARDQVLAGTSIKGDIFTYTELLADNPNNESQMVQAEFDEVFRNDPAPAQYYSYDNKTFARNDANIGIAKNYDASSPNYIKQSVVIKGNTLTGAGVTTEGSRFFEYSDGSDWEQALSLNLPNQNFFNVKCASVSELTSLENVVSIDGYTLKAFDIVIIKDQPSTSTIRNGIYRNEYGTLVRYNSFGFYENSMVVGFYVENGYVNGKNRYLLSLDNFYQESFDIYKPKYTIEFELMNLAYSSATSCNPLEGCSYLNQLLDNEEKISSSTGYTGYQGFEVADLYGIFNLQVNNSNLKLSSGDNLISKDLSTFGIRHNWRFSNSTGSTTDGWAISDFVSSMIGTTEAAYDQANNQYTRYLLRITPSSIGNPKIIYSNLNTQVEPNDCIKIRCKIAPFTDFGFNDSKINIYWSYDSTEFTNKSSVKIDSNTDYVEYIIKPVWKGVVNNIQLEFENLPDLGYNSAQIRSTYIYIDYIKIVNDDTIFDLNNSFSKIRVIVEDRDIKVYLGKQEYPFINAKNFINLDNFNIKYIDPNKYAETFNKPYIRFGKISNNAGNSLFAYSKMSFAVGSSLEPINKKIYDFNHSQRLPSSGGIRFFTYHDGTIYCMTDGFDSNKVNDNPDDRQAKAFEYDVDTLSWIPQNISFERKQVFNSDGTYDLYGIVRPIMGASYKGSLYISGQYKNIKVE